MTGGVLGCYTDFVRQGRDLRRGRVGGDMKSAGEEFVAREGATSGLHGGSGRADGDDHGV